MIVHRLLSNVFSLQRLSTLGGLLTLVLTQHSAAQDSPLISNELLEVYPRAAIVEESEGSVEDYRLATSAARRVGGRWAGDELRLDGALARLTMEIPEGHDPEHVYRYYRQRLLAADARALYQCQERNCGSSNSWANDVFEVKLLYGLDQHQYYGVFEVVGEGDLLNYVAVYTVRRGNRRVYAHLELLKTEQASSAAAASNPAAIIEQLRDQGYYPLAGLQLDSEKLQIQPQQVEALVKALGTDRRLKLRIVGHDYSDRPLAEQLERSRNFAEQLQAQLIAAGIAEDRLEAHGIGSLAPPRMGKSGRERSFRVELVAGERP